VNLYPQESASENLEATNQRAHFVTITEDPALTKAKHPNLSEDDLLYHLLDLYGREVLEQRDIRLRFCQIEKVNTDTQWVKDRMEDADKIKKSTFDIKNLKGNRGRKGNFQCCICLAFLAKKDNLKKHYWLHLQVSYHF